MLTPEFLDSCTDELRGFYDELDAVACADVAVSLAKEHGESTQAAHDEAVKTLAAALSAAVMVSVAITNKSASKELRKVFTAVEENSLPVDEDGSPVSASSMMDKILAYNYNKTNRTMSNLTRTTAFTSQQAYITASDRAYLRSVSGECTREKAIADAIKECASTGTTVSYASGQSISLDAAVRRNVMTSVNQTGAALALQSCDDMDCDYVETTAHGGARPTHEVWQGQVFCISGKDKRYKKFKESTGYGEIDGLCGANCRHSFYPFWPGFSKPAYTKAMLDDYKAAKYTYNDKMLTEADCRTIQSRYEREIRESKRTLASYESALNATDDEALKAELQQSFEKESTLLKRRQARLSDLLNQTGLTRRTARTDVVAVKDGAGNIVGFTRATAKKANAAARAAQRAVEKHAQAVYNKKQEISELIRSGQLSTKLNVGNQNKHIIGHVQGSRSYIYGTIEDAQRLINKYSGTGVPRLDKKLGWTNKESCKADHVIGVVVDQTTGEETETRSFFIHYGKRGTHIVPKKEG